MPTKSRHGQPDKGCYVGQSNQMSSWQAHISTFLALAQSPNPTARFVTRPYSAVPAERLR